MLIQFICQWIMLIGLFLKFFFLAYVDFNGSPEKKPGGFEGLIVTCVAVLISASLLYLSGAFSLLVR